MIWPQRGKSHKTDKSWTFSPNSSISIYRLPDR